VPLAVWDHEWVVHVQHAGTGEKVLEYLARYVFRIALVNSRLERFEDGQVTFRYRDGRTGLVQRCTLDAVAFLGRILQHVLPQGFTKVRHYGLFSPSRRDLLTQAREQLVAASATTPGDPAPVAPAITPAPPGAPRPCCPACGTGVLHIVETLHPSGRSP
jgi:putative transposase